MAPQKALTLSLPPNRRLPTRGPQQMNGISFRVFAMGAAFDGSRTGEGPSITITTVHPRPALERPDGRKRRVKQRLSPTE